ncbi:MAG: hypothetical protein LUC83_08170 [Clostridiales bacterium]|nr:hypothetical protein [Clostridiales bacterium]
MIRRKRRGAETAAAADGEVAFRAETEGITVAATAKEGVLPDGAVMHVTLLEAEDEETKNQYTGAEEALMDNDVGYEGMAAMDICFTDAGGNEVEPEEGSVSVKIDMDVALLGDDIDTDSLTVWHLAETAEDSIEVQSVADAADETEGTVAVEDDTMTAEFEVEDFSTYTVTWTSPNPDRIATLHFVGEDGKDISEELGVSGSQTVLNNGSLENSGSNGDDGLDVVGDSYSNKNDSGYYYVASHLDSYTGTAATDISYNSGWHYYVGGSWHEWNNSDGSRKYDESGIYQ